jgi:hypothetical protein
VTREEAGAKVPHEIQARGVRGGNDASGLVILVWDCPSAQRRAGLRRAAGLSLPPALALEPLVVLLAVGHSGAFEGPG